VEESSLIALARSAVKSDDSPSILRDVRLVSDLGRLQHMLQSADGPDKFRLYAGYAGWAPEQLEEEVDAGAWHIFPGNANIVFDSDPDTLWLRLIKRSETQIANRGRRDVRLPLSS
jgi:putative transcriptional regulator